MYIRQADIDNLRIKLINYLHPAQNRNSYICPICGSGTGPNKTGAMRVLKDGIHCKCFSCGFYGDIFDLVGQEQGLNAKESYKKVKALFTTSPPTPSRETLSQRALPLATVLPTSTTGHNYAAYIDTCAAALHHHSAALDYLHRRGFTDDTLTYFQVGYDADTGQLVLPYGSDGRYFIRRGVGEAKVFYKPPAVEAGPEPVFNDAALDGNGCVFVVESPLCALSILQVGGVAIAIGGTGGNKLLARLAKKPTTAVLALSLDNDDRGQDAQKQLLEALLGSGVSAVPCNVAGNYKDPNEALQQEPQPFADRVGKLSAFALQQRDSQTVERRDAYLAGSAHGYLSDFLDGVAARAHTPVMPTGFPALDAALDGGLYEGLYVLGALSSLGKTSFTLQMADQIAAQGHDVLFFSLEMARSELMAKSISRHTWLESGGDDRLAKSARDISDGARYPTYANSERQLITRAVEAYGHYAMHLYLVEGATAPLGTRDIEQRIAEHVETTGNSPVVVVDYLQILAPAEPRATDKQNTDRAVFDLKRLSRHYKIPILVISSLNRENYASRLTMSAFKESGAIEYSSDVLLGLQFALPPGDDRLTQDRLDELKRQVPRPLEVVVLKNRHGLAGNRVALAYRAAYNLFDDRACAPVTGRR